MVGGIIQRTSAGKTKLNYQWHGGNGGICGHEVELANQSTLSRANKPDFVAANTVCRAKGSNCAIRTIRLITDLYRRDAEARPVMMLEGLLRRVRQITGRPGNRL